MRPLPQKLLDRLPGSLPKMSRPESVSEEIIKLLREENKRLEEENRELKRQLATRRDHDSSESDWVG